MPASRGPEGLRKWPGAAGAEAARTPCGGSLPLTTALPSPTCHWDCLTPGSQSAPNSGSRPGGEEPFLGARLMETSEAAPQTVFESKHTRWAGCKVTCYRCARTGWPCRNRGPWHDRGLPQAGPSRGPISTSPRLCPGWPPGCSSTWASGHGACPLLIGRSHTGPEAVTHTWISGQCSLALDDLVDVLGAALRPASPQEQGSAFTYLPHVGRAASLPSRPWASGSSQPCPVMCIWGFWPHPTRCPPERAPGQEPGMTPTS